MKNLNKMNLSLAVSFMIFLSSVSFAATPVIDYGDQNSAWVLALTDVNDLLQSDLSSYTPTGNFNAYNMTPLGASALNDGQFFVWPTQFVSWVNDNVVEYYLDTSVNTYGYDISSIDTYGGWNDSGRDAQQYSIYYSLAGDPNINPSVDDWILYDSVNYNPASPVSQSLSRLSWSVGLQNVDAIKFVAPASTENGGVGLCEIDVIGIPSTQWNTITTVDAGADQDVFLHQGAVDVSLNGTVTSNGSYTLLWSVVSQPAGSTVVFTPEMPEEPNVLAQLDTAGTYVFGLTGIDGNLNPSDTVTIRAYDPGDDLFVTIDTAGLVAYGPGVPYYSPWIASNSDLLQTSVASVDAVGVFGGPDAMPLGTYGGVGCLTNGFFGLRGNDYIAAWNTDNFPELAMMSSNNVLDYFLNTSMNTFGYDITTIVTYGGWQDTGRDQQNYAIWYSVVGSEDWALLDSVKVQPDSLPGGYYSAIRVVFPVNLANVDAISVVGGSDTENGWTGMGEIDVFGTPSTSIAPIVNASAEPDVWLDNGIVNVSLDGTVTSGGSYTVLWSVVSQPAGSAVVFTPETPDVEDVIVQLDAAGTYLLRLTADDGEFTPSATVTIEVYESACAYAQDQPGFEWSVGDINYDCQVNLEDVGILAANWLACNHPGCL